MNIEQILKTGNAARAIWEARKEFLAAGYKESDWQKFVEISVMMGPAFDMAEKLDTQ